KGEDTPGVTIARTLDRVTLGILSRLPILDGGIFRTVIGALTLEAGLSVRTVGIPRPDRQGAQLAAQHQAIAALVQDLVLDRPDVFIEGDGVVVERAFERSVLDRRLSRLRLFFILIGDLGAGRVRVVLIFL